MAAPNIVATANVLPVTDYAAVTTSTSVLTENAADSGKVYKINSIVVSNVDGTNDATVTVDLYRNSTAYYIAYEVTVPAGGSLVVMSKDTSIYLIEGDQIRCSGSADGDLNISCSYEIISESEITIPEDTGGGFSGYTTSPLSTATYSSATLSVSGQETNPCGFYIKPDNTKLYLVGTITDDVYEYNITSITDVTSFSYASVQRALSYGFPEGVVFSPNGDKMFVADSQIDNVAEYTLSTPWNITTVSLTATLSVGALEATISTLEFDDTGTKLFIAGRGNNKIIEYDLPTAYSFLPGGVTLSSNVSPVLQTVSGGSGINGIHFYDNGNRMLSVAQGGSGSAVIFDYTLSTPYDITTVSYTGNSFTSSAFGAWSQEVVIRDEGVIYLLDSDNDVIHQIDF